MVSQRRSLFPLFSVLLLVSRLDCVKLNELRYEEMEQAADYLTFDEKLQFRSVGRPYNRIFNRINGKLIGDISKLEKYSSEIDRSLFAAQELDEIVAIGNEYKLNSLYRQKLINILRNAHLQTVDTQNDSDRNTTFINFRNFMDALNIKTITVNEYIYHPQVLLLQPPYIQLLVIISRIIAHPFVFSSTSSNTTSRSLHTHWNNQSFLAVKYYSEVLANENAYFVFKIIYDHCYMMASLDYITYLPRSSEIQYLQPGIKQMKQLHTLMDKWNFIPWSLPPSQIVDIPMLMDIITVYDQAMTVTFGTVLRRYLFSENFMVELHSRFIFTILKDDHIHFDHFDGYPAQSMIMRKILRRMFRFLAPAMNNAHPALRETAELIYKKNGSCFLRGLLEFDAHADIRYHALLIDILNEMNTTKK